MSKLVVVIQCALTQQHCSGYNCTHAFYTRTGKFEGYPEDTHYMTFECGGCCGANLGVKLENLRKRLKRFEETDQEVIIHLASCMVTDNHHKPPCPNLAFIEELLRKKNFRKVVKGSYISKTASTLREKGIYKKFE